MNIKEVLTISEAAALFNLDVSTIRKLFYTDKLIENIDYRKSGSTWLVSKESLEKYYKKKN